MNLAETAFRLDEESATVFLFGSQVDRMIETERELVRNELAFTPLTEQLDLGYPMSIQELHDQIAEETYRSALEFESLQMADNRRPARLIQTINSQISNFMVRFQAQCL
jgi:hypothetical protein